MDWIILPAVTITALLVLGIATGRCRRECRRMEERFELEKSALRRECMSDALDRQIQYEALQSQINPHFLYNTLDSIRGEALMAGNKSIADMTERLSRFFRYCISNRGNTVTVRDEMNNVRDYFYIQEYRFGEKFRLETEIEETCYNYRMPQMTLQPIVENAIFHGLEKKKEGGNVRIAVFETGESVRIRVSDNGLGMEEERLLKINESLRLDEKALWTSKEKEKRSGIALHNVNARIHLLYGEDYGITLRSTLGLGTDVDIILPKRTETG